MVTIEQHRHATGRVHGKKRGLIETAEFTTLLNLLIVEVEFSQKPHHLLDVNRVFATEEFQGHECHPCPNCL